MVCPFISTNVSTEIVTKDSLRLTPCLNNCALYIKGQCAFAVIAQNLLKTK